MIDYGRIRFQGQKKLPCQFWTDGFVPLVEFGIGNIVQQGSEAYDLDVHFFILRDQEGIVEYPLNVEPIMATLRPLQSFLYKSDRSFYLFYIGHAKNVTPFAICCSTLAMILSGSPEFSIGACTSKVICEPRPNGNLPYRSIFHELLMLIGTIRADG